jgi:hypothetical protein
MRSCESKRDESREVTRDRGKDRLALGRNRVHLGKALPQSRSDRVQVRRVRVDRRFDRVHLRRVLAVSRGDRLYSGESWGAIVQVSFNIEEVIA